MYNHCAYAIWAQLSLVCRSLCRLCGQHSLRNWHQPDLKLSHCSAALFPDVLQKRSVSLSTVHTGILLNSAENSLCEWHPDPKNAAPLAAAQKHCPSHDDHDQQSWHGISPSSSLHSPKGFCLWNMQHSASNIQDSQRMPFVTLHAA